MIRLVRELDIDDIADARADQSVTDRGLVGNLALEAVRLCGSDDVEVEVLIVILVMDLDVAADVDLVCVSLVLIDDLCVLQDVLDLLDTGLDITLLVLRRVVLGVLGEVALLAGLTDLLGNFLSLIDLEVVQLVLELLETCVGHNILLYCLLLCHWTCTSKR